MFSREKVYPTLLITSAQGIPEWISSFEALKLAVGLCNFTCCQRNHIFPEIGVVPCDRDITCGILETLIASKVEYFHKMEKVKLARIFHVMTGWWTRTSSSSKNRSKPCKSVAELKLQLKWDESVDGQDAITPWIDRYGISILAYSMPVNEINVVREILNLYEDRKTHLLSWRFPKEGVIEAGIPGHSACLHGAMCFASPEIVIALLDAGADIKMVDVNGSDPLMAAALSQQLANVKIWFTKNDKWNVNSRGLKFGATALSIALYSGRQNLSLVRYLIEEQGANEFMISSNGHSSLTSLCSNDDCDPKVVRYLLKQRGLHVNYQITSQTIKWKMLRATARLVVRSKIKQSNLLRRIAEGGGLTPLHYAARRGDVEVVEILMSNGANHSIKNDMGRDVLSYVKHLSSCLILLSLFLIHTNIHTRLSRFAELHSRIRHHPHSYCESFPEMREAILRAIKEASHLGVKTTNERRDFSLQRRLSTATKSTYDMWLLPLHTVFKLYGDSTGTKTKIECHQSMKSQDLLIRVEDLPMGSYVFFVSHQWLGYDHPDPNNVKIKTFLQSMRRLRDGEINRVEMDALHRRLYRHRHTTRAKEWRGMLTNAYVWFDWWSQPQPTACNDLTERSKLTADLQRAIRSMPSYVERSDFIVVLVPGAIHADRIDPTTNRRAFACYRTWRTRAFCVLEMFAAYLSRRKTHPMLLIQSSLSDPIYISPLDAQKLAVGRSKFSCCERNHAGELSKCSRPIARENLEVLVQAKIAHLFKIRDIAIARWFFCMKQWWLRGLPESSLYLNEDVDLQKSLAWEEKTGDGDWFDRYGRKCFVHNTTYFLFSHTHTPNN